MGLYGFFFMSFIGFYKSPKATGNAMLPVEKWLVTLTWAWTQLKSSQHIGEVANPLSHQVLVNDDFDSDKCVYGITLNTTPIHRSKKDLSYMSLLEK